nr:DNA replication helicase [Chroomonas debatzensis]
MKNFTAPIETQKVPHNYFAEQIILAHILLNSTNLTLIFNRLNPEVFYIYSHKCIYTAAFNLYTQGQVVNITSVSDKLEEIGVLETIGGSRVLLELVNIVVPSCDLDQYIVILTDKYLRRALIAIAHKISKLGYNTFYSVESLFETAEQMLFSLTQIKPKFGLLPASEVLLETFLEMEKKSNHGVLAGLSTGFFDLDLLTQGFQKSDLIILAGRPSMGKTAFALNLGRNIAELQPFPVAIFSLEMSRQQIIYRFLSTESQIINSRLRSGRITRTEWGLVSKAIEYLATLNIYLDDTPNTSLVDISSKLTRLRSTYGEIGLTIIDYLQLITDTYGKNNRVQELSRITRNLKMLAREFDFPLLVLSQLSRTVESRANKRPLLADLRESGCLAGGSSIYINSLDRFLTIGQLLTKRSSYIVSKSCFSLQTKLSYIRKTFSTGFKSTYILTILGGYKLQLTLTHKLLTTKGWLPLQNLVPRSLVAIFDRYNFPKALDCHLVLSSTRSSIFTYVLSINLSKSIKVYDLSIPELYNFVSNDLFVHNSIEQDADLVLMLYRDNYYSPARETKNVTEIIIAKHRNGPTGTISLIFDPTIASFTNFVLAE